MQTYIAVYYSHTNNARKYTKKNILLCVPLWNLCGTLWKNLSHEDVYSAPMELIGTVMYIFYYDVAPTGHQR